MESAYSRTALAQAEKDTMGLTLHNFQIFYSQNIGGELRNAGWTEPSCQCLRAVGGKFLGRSSKTGELEELLEGQVSATRYETCFVDPRTFTWVWAPSFCCPAWRQWQDPRVKYHISLSSATSLHLRGHRQSRNAQKPWWRRTSSGITFRDSSMQCTKIFARMLRNNSSTRSTTSYTDLPIVGPPARRGAGDEEAQLK